MRIRILCFVLTALVLSGCKTSVQLSATNNTPSTLVYTVSVDGQEKLSQPVAKDAPLVNYQIGKFKRGKKVETTVALQRGGRVSRSAQVLPAKPDPFTVVVQVDKIDAQWVEIKSAVDIEKTITDVSESFLPPTTLVSEMPKSFGGLFVCTSRRDDAAALKCDQFLSPDDLSSKVADGWYGNEEFPLKFAVQYILDENRAAKLAAEIPTLGSVKADYAASDLYKFELSLRNAGWRTHTHSWGQVEGELQKTQSGRERLAQIKGKLAKLALGEHLYYLDRAYIVGLLDVSTYQAQRLGTNVDVKATNYIAANAAYDMSNVKFDTMKGENLVLRVKYTELKLVDPISMTLVDVGSGSVGVERPDYRIMSSDAHRKGSRFDSTGRQ